MTPDVVRRMTITIPARLENVALVGLSVRAASAFELFTGDEAVLIELAVCEALNNAIIHALKKHPDESVELEITLCPDRMAFRLCDCGDAIPKDISAPPPESIDPLATSGRGLTIMHGIMDTVRYERVSGRNILTLEKLAGKDPARIP